MGRRPTGHRRTIWFGGRIQGGRLAPFQEPSPSTMGKLMHHSTLRVLSILPISAGFLVREQVKKELETSKQMACWWPGAALAGRHSLRPKAGRFASPAWRVASVQGTVKQIMLIPGAQNARRHKHGEAVSLADEPVCRMHGAWAVLVQVAMTLPLAAPTKGDAETL